MARRTPDARLESKESRSRLASRDKPHYRLLEPGLHIGYRRLKGRKGRPAVAGTWVARHYIGGQSYAVERIGTADDFSDADGTIILSFAQAQDKARAHMLRRAQSANGIAGPLRVQAAVEMYLQVLEAHGKSAVDSRHRARAHIFPVLGNVEVATLSTDLLRKWHAGLIKALRRTRTKLGKPQQHREFDGGEEATRRRKSSANRVLTILKAALNHAFRDGKTPTDSAWRKVKPFKDVDAARVRYLSIVEATRVINASDPEFRPLVQAALQTGCRYGDLARLEVSDFNPDSGTLAIPSKSGKARHVVLTDEGVSFFRQLIAGRAGSEIMLRKVNGEAWRASHQLRPIAQACQRANISPPINFHALRHTWASLSVMSGVPLLVVAKNLGHADTRMIERHYGHLAPSYIAEAIRAGAPKFGFTPDPKLSSLQEVPCRNRERCRGRKRKPNPSALSQIR
jgi:integrase